MRKPGFVYVMQCENIYKIGSSHDPDKRLKGFGGDSIIFKDRRIYFAYHTTIIRRFQVENMLEVERYLQSVFNKKRIREPGAFSHRRDWFHLDKSDIERIDSLMLEIWS